MAYSYSRSITIDHTKVGASDSSNFPVLVANTYSWLATVANGGLVQNASGFDVIFTSDAAGLTLLSWEVESYNATTGAVVYWVKVPTVSHTASTVIYIWYGNAAISTDQSNKTGTWDSNYKAVWHFGSTSSLALGDSTSNANTLTNHGATAAAGEIFGGAACDLTPKYLTGPAIAASAYTISVWFNTSHNYDQGAGGTYGGFIETLNAGTGRNYSLSIDDGAGIAPNYLTAGMQDTSNNYYSCHGVAINDGLWHLAVASYDGTTMRLSMDGAFVSSIAVPSAATPASTGFGSSPAGGSYLVGTMDEARISNVMRSADWITAEYANQFSPSTFYTVGPQTGASTPLISSWLPNAELFRELFGLNSY